MNNGADVINRSFSGECNFWCRNFGSLSGWDDLAGALDHAKRNKVPVLVSAGNDECLLPNCRHKRLPKLSQQEFDSPDKCFVGCFY